MANSVDERVVSMKFDNAQFESGAKESMSTIDKLLEKLKLTDSAEGFSNLDKAAKGLDLSGISSGVDAAASKFSALETIAVGALLNIGHKVADLGVNLVKSLSVDQIGSGFNEYEQKMGSVQTILNNVKWDESVFDTEEKKLNKVNEVLRDLNKYSDDTIYSFSDMKSAIAKFVNAGIDLDDAKIAIEGIANAAALSGANAAEAGRAYYNLAQSLSTGSLKLQDWRSIENANMNSQILMQTIVDVGREMGALDDELGNIGGGLKAADVNAKNFRNSIEGVKGGSWVTQEVLLAAFAKFGDQTTDIGAKAYQAATEVKTLTMLMDTLREAVQSGWADTFEVLIGDYEESKKVWTAVSNEIGGILGDQADARNALLKDWKELGGRDAAMQSFVNVWTALKQVLTVVKNVVTDIFPPITGQTLYDLTKKVEAFTESLIPTQLELDLLKQTLRRIIPWFKVVFEVFKSFGKVGAAVGRAIMSIAKAFGYHLQSVTSYGEELQTVDDVCQRIVEVTEKVVGWIDKAADSVSDFIENFHNNDYVAKFLAKLESLYDFVSAKLQPLLANISFEKIGSFFTNFESYLPTKEDFIGYFVGLWDNVTRLINGEITLDDIFGNTDIEGPTTINASLQDFVDNTKEYASKTEVLSGALVKLSDAFSIVGESMKKFAGGFGAFVKEYGGLVAGLAMDIAIMYGIYRLFGFITKVVNMALGLQAALTNITNSAAGVLTGFTKIEKSIAIYINAAAIANSLVKLAVAFGILAFTLALLANVNDQGKLEAVSKIMFKYFLVLSIVFGLSVLAVSLLAKNEGKIHDAGNIFLGIAIIVGLMAGILVLMAKTCDESSMENIYNGIKGFSLLSLVIGAFAAAIASTEKWLDKWGKAPRAIKALSGFIVVLTGVLYALSIIGSNDEAMWQGVFAFIALAATLALFAWGISKLDSKLGTIAPKVNHALEAILGLILGMLALAATLYILGNVDYDAIRNNWDILAIGFIAFVVSLMAIATVADEYGDKLGIALLGIGAALLMTAAAFYILANSGGDTSFAIRFMLGFVAVVLLFGFLGHLMQTMGNIGEFTKVMLSIAASLLIVSIAFRMLGSLTKEQFMQGMYALLPSFIVVISTIVALTHTCGEKDIKMGVGMIMALASLIAVLAAAIVLLAAIPDTDRVVMSMMSLFLPLVALVALMAVIFAITDKMKATSINDMKYFIISLAVFVGVFAAAVIVMSKLLDTDKLIPVLASLGLGLAALAVMMLVITKMKIKNVKNSIASVILAIVMLAALVAAMAILGSGNLDWKGMLAGTVGIIAILAVMTAVLALFKGSRTKSILSAAAAMVIMSVAVAVLAGSLFLLCQVDSNKLIAATIVIGVLIVLVTIVISVLAGIGTTAAAAAAGFIALAGSLAALAGSLALLGLALILIVSSILVVGIGIASIGLGLIVLGFGIHTMTDEMIYCTSRVPELCKNLALAIAAFYEFMIVLSDLGPKIALLMSATVTLMISEFLRGIASGLPEIIDSAFLLILSFIYGLADAINTYQQDIFTAIAYLNASITNAILGFFGMGSNDDESSEMKNIGDGIIGGLIRGIVEGFISRSHLLSGIADGIKEVLSGNIFGKKVNKEITGTKEDFDAVNDNAHHIGKSYVSGITDEISSEESKSKVSSAALGLSNEVNKALEENKPEVHIMTEQDARMQAEQKKAGASAMESFTGGAEEFLSGEGSIDIADSLKKGFLDKLNLPSGDYNIKVPDFLGSIGLSGDGFNAAGTADGESYTNGLMGALQNGGLGDIPLDNLSLDNISGLSTASLAPMFESGSGTSTDPGQISAVLSVDTESAQEDIYNMMDATQLTKVVGQDVHGKIDATYTSSAAEMDQQRTMIEGVMNTAVDKINEAVANLPQPINKVEVKIAGDMRKFMQATQKEAMEYQKRTGRPAFG